MIEITREPIPPELIANKVKTDSSGCVVTYIGLIRECSRGKPALSVLFSRTLHQLKYRVVIV